MRSLVVRLALLSVLSFPAAAQETAILLTGGAAGVYYPLGIAFARIVSEHVPEIRISVQATKASAENLNLLQAGRGDIAFTLGDTLVDAWDGNGDAGFPHRLDRLRAIAAIYPNYIQLVARADSGIRRLSDLKGKRVAVGAARSGTELNARAIFGANGIRYADFARVEYRPFAESVRMMQDGQLDATLISAGLGVAAIRDLSVQVPVALVAITPAEVAMIGNPALQPATIPAGTYSGQTRPAPTIRIRNYLATREDLPAELVYRLTRAMFENLDAMVAAHPAARDIVPAEASRGMPLPLHPGAERYWREKGLLR